MKTENLVNKENEVLTTKEGVVMTRNRLEPGDQFIPQMEKYLERGLNKDLLVNIRDKNNESEQNGAVKEVWISLTTGQAKVIDHAIKSGKVITQHAWHAYEYQPDGYDEKAIGIGIKNHYKKPKTFEDFEQEVE